VIPSWLFFLVPEGIVILTAFVALTADVALLRKKELSTRLTVAGLIACAGCLAAMWWLQAFNLLVATPSGEHVMRPDWNYFSLLTLSPLSQFIKQVILCLTIFTVLISFGAKFTRHVGEYIAMLLMATVGLMLLVSSLNLLMIFVSLELLSVSLYAMVAFNKSSLSSAEAALKYFLFGSMAAAFTLFGISLIYGLTGELDLTAIAAKLQTGPVQPALYLALVMTLIGFAFKLAAAPFHLWAPDAYQGAPTPVAAFIASGSKVGSFYVLWVILYGAFPNVAGSATLCGFQSGWMPIIALLALLSVVVGNVAALAQTSVKRLLAYSAIAHAGYALLAFFNGVQGMSALMFYVITYAMTVLGAFAVVSVVESETGGDSYRDFAGLSRRSPLLSACMAVFMLSLAGIPPLAGFFGKFFVFVDALGAAKNLGLLWLVIVAISASAVSLYYYLQVLKQIYVADPPETAGAMRTNTAAKCAIVALAVAVVLLGCFPGILLTKLSSL